MMQFISKFPQNLICNKISLISQRCNNKRRSEKERERERETERDLKDGRKCMIRISLNLCSSRANFIIDSSKCLSVACLSNMWFLILFVGGQSWINFIG